MRFIPEAPRFKTNYSETKLFESLKALGLALDWTVIHSAQIGRDPDVRFGETDFYVLIPGKGIVRSRQRLQAKLLTKTEIGTLRARLTPKRAHWLKPIELELQ